MILEDNFDDGETVIGTKSSQISNFMIKNIVKATGKTTLTEAAKIMLEKKIGSILIEDNTTYSVLTKTDIMKTIARGKNPSAVYAKEVASRPIITCFSTDTLEDAMLTMSKHKIERLYVVDPKNPGQIIGIISASDILRITPGLLEIKREHMFIEEAGRAREQVFNGYCDDCGNYGELHDVGGFAICKECLHKGSTGEENSSDTSEDEGVILK